MRVDYSIESRGRVILDKEHYHGCVLKHKILVPSIHGDVAPFQQKTASVECNEPGLAERVKKVRLDGSTGIPRLPSVGKYPN